MDSRRVRRAPPDNRRRMQAAFLITVSFMVVELVGGWLSGSLALLADAGHMLTDSMALALALYAFRLSERPSDLRRSYGYQRAQVLAAFANGAALILIVGWITMEALSRLMTPREVDVRIMLIVAALGLAANGLAFLVLHGGDRQNLNMRGATLHVLSDMLGSIAALLAGVIIYTTGWTRVDPLLSLVVATLVFVNAWRLLRQAGHILLEGTPDWLDTEEIKRTLTADIDKVVGIHHLHAWCLTHERPLVTLHAELSPGADYGKVLIEVKQFLRERYRIEHSTVQLEPSRCADDPIGEVESDSAAIER